MIKNIALFILYSFSFLLFIYFIYLIGPFSAELDVKRLTFTIIACVLCFVFANLERVTSLKMFGFAITLAKANKVIQDANETVEQLRAIAIPLSEIMVENLQGQGRFGSGDTRQKEIQKQNILAILRDLKVSKNEIKKISSADRKWVSIDYAALIFSSNPDPVHNREWEAYWKIYHDTVTRPTASECSAVLKRFQIETPEALEWGIDYRHYEKTGTHRRLDEWLSRYDKRDKGR
ncbi:hypothetical protein FV226_21755 [Methylobacterium sp. WL12]|uniref:hypothetical protein n=1 Tax=Methylobacterium sp. WL12 TaxID=2603890 RepID=UPI0011C831B9|nr:hypothetical protein [Methylobacterium sp. WL12]TXM67460.1 hypothetical protein FV226_21755 [Methylobacterium sp. WL12]